MRINRSHAPVDFRLNNDPALIHANDKLIVQIKAVGIFRSDLYSFRGQK
jgi:threonine dehydrogenase-like Zn-dependent dehydrogenase